MPRKNVELRRRSYSRTSYHLGAVFAAVKSGRHDCGGGSSVDLSSVRVCFVGVCGILEAGLGYVRPVLDAVVAPGLFHLELSSGLSLWWLVRVAALAAVA